MAKKKKEKEKTLLNKFSRRVYGLLLIAAGWLLLAAVCFYSPADSSFNLAVHALVCLSHRCQRGGRDSYLFGTGAAVVRDSGDGMGLSSLPA